MSKIIDKRRAILGVFLCLVVVSVAQMIQMGVQQGLSAVPFGIGNIISSFVYIGVTYGVLFLICTKVLGISMKECRIGKVKLSFKWILVAIALPLLVSFGIMLFPGTFTKNSMSQVQRVTIITQMFFVYGISAGIVEEFIFRGVMMSALDQSFGKKWAILVPSVIFGLGHVANGNGNPLHMLLILVAGICVGVTFSLIVYESNSVWCSAIVHAVWNMIVIGGVLTISTVPCDNTIFSYVINDKYQWLTGGFTSIEPSIIAIVGYCIVALYAYLCIKKKSENQIKNA